MCVILKINIVQDAFGLTAIGSLKLEGFMGYVASGIAISISSNISAWAAERPYKLANKDLKEGNPVPGSEVALQTTLPTITSPVAPVSFTELPTEPIKTEEATLIEELPQEPPQAKYRTKLLTDYDSGETKPEYLLIEKDTGEKKVIKLS